MKKYIFFIREYNDWDNIAPIIYLSLRLIGLNIKIKNYS